MYSRPSAAAPAATSARTAIGGTFAAILCLGLVLFAIAATIVIALIPVYIPTKDVDTNDETQNYYFSLQPLNGSLNSNNNGNLNAATRNALANAIGTGSGVGANAPVIDQAVIGTSSGRRRRSSISLARNKRQVISGTNVYCRGRFQRRFCRNNCRILRTQFTIVVAIYDINGNFLGNIAFFVTVYSFEFTFPNNNISTTTLSPGVTTSAGTATTARSTTTTATTTTTRSTTTTATPNMG